MEEKDFEGTIVLERLAEINKVDAFFDAVDADDLAKAKKLMSMAGIDSETIKWVLQKMSETDGEH